MQVSVFFLFPGKVMPLHDHPRMTVISKILLGSARVTSYDWMQPSLCLDRRCKYTHTFMSLLQNVVLR